MIEEPSICLCGAPLPCDCLNPQRIISLKIEVRATDNDSMPSAEQLASGLRDLMPDDWTWYPDEHSFRVVGIFDAETVESLNMPSPNEEGPCESK